MVQLYEQRVAVHRPDEQEILIADGNRTNHRDVQKGEQK
jgi:hypothetical protein